jgi:hypothetical protein
VRSPRPCGRPVASPARPRTSGSHALARPKAGPTRVHAWGVPRPAEGPGAPTAKRNLRHPGCVGRPSAPVVCYGRLQSVPAVFQRRGSIRGASAPLHAASSTSPANSRGGLTSLKRIDPNPTRHDDCGRWSNSSGHAVEQSLAVYRILALSDVAAKYEAAMQHFPVR